MIADVAPARASASRAVATSSDALSRITIRVDLNSPKEEPPPKAAECVVVTKNRQGALKSPQAATIGYRPSQNPVLLVLLVIGAVVWMFLRR